MAKHFTFHSEENLKALYIHTEDIHNLSAPEEIAPLILKIIQPNSILDVGCGTGTWLKAFEQLGVQDYLGIDGSYVDRQLLKISEDRFHAMDLRKPWNLDRKFDLVLCLEVAEHLQKEYSDAFVEGLARHGDLILFSAAIPGQGGQNHLNEQWLSYWVDKFKRIDYHHYDVIRHQIWNNKAVDVWYKQNMVVFCKNGHVLTQQLRDASSPYLDIVHPELFKFYSYQAERAKLYEQGKLGIRSALNALTRALINKFS